MLVSVIMPVYNTKEFLHESIVSILDQTHTDLEFIILDDGSTENIKDLILSYNDPRIIFCSNEKNRGLTYSLNKCMDLASGDYFLRMDADDISYSTRVEKQLLLFEPKVGFVGTHCTEFPKRRRNYSYNSTNETLNTQYARKHNMSDPTMMFSREVFDKIGYFDTTMILGQTFNYGLRILKYFEARIVEEILYSRRIHKDMVTKRLRSTTDWTLKSKQRADKYPIIKEFDSE